MKKIFLKVLILLVSVTALSQNKGSYVVPDSLKKMSFDELEKRFNRSLLDKKRNVYAETYYKKSKNQKDKIIRAKGLYMKGILHFRDVESLKYADSIILLTKTFNNFEYPAKAYLLKSSVYFTNNELQKALQNILIAEKYSKKTTNFEQIAQIKQQIGLIKIELGKPEEALPLVLENYNYYKSIKSDSPYYIYSAWILSDIYNCLDMPEESLYYSNTLEKSITKNNTYYKYFLLSKGISYHLKKDFARSNLILDSSIKRLKLVDDKSNLSIAYYYRGENALQIDNDVVKATNYFNKVDSILLKPNEFTRVLRNNYLRLIEISKKSGDNKQQLYYLNRLIKIDEFLNKNNVVLAKKINKNYDIPHLLAEKEVVIAQINYEKNVFFVIVFLVLTGLVFSLFYLFKIKREKKIFQEKFNIVIEQSKEKSNHFESNEKELEEVKIKSVDLAEDIVEDLLRKLILFEKQKKYLFANVKLNELAKEFNTNSTYLSKTINQFKNKNFSQYVNDLRIDYSIEKLQNNIKFRKYTIKAIAEEVGFSNAESFAKSFYNKTGMQPSFFIKKLEEDNKL